MNTVYNAIYSGRERYNTALIIIYKPYLDFQILRDKTTLINIFNTFIHQFTGFSVTHRGSPQNNHPSLPILTCSPLHKGREKNPRRNY